jgi:hypothetical protein
MPGYNKDLPYWARTPAFLCGEKRPRIAKISKSAWRALNFECFVGVTGLVAGAGGQFGVAMDMFPAPVPKFMPIFMFVFLLPVYAIWLPVFCNQPLLPFQTYIRWCFYMSCCSVGAALLFEFYYFLGLLPVRNATVFTIMRIIMHLGWISFVPQIHYWILSKKYPAS